MKTRPLIAAIAAIVLAGAANFDLKAAPIVSSLTPGGMTSSQFNSLFTPMASAPVLSAAYQFMNTPVTGVVESQVFQGTGAAAGLYAYAYQIVVNPVIDSSGQPTSVNSASMLFNASPIASNLIDGTSASYSAYVVKDGSIGGIPAPLAGPGAGIQFPASITLMTGSSSRSLTLQFLNPNAAIGPLEAGARSATVVILSTIPFTTQSISIQNANPQISYPIAYAPIATSVPEPTTVLGWAGVIVGGVLLRRHRSRSRS